MEPRTIEIRHSRVHNLDSVSLSLPRNSLIVFTGVSGSGKSSLAFDTLYAEGQRRYIESLSSYARQFMGQMQKPDCDMITGLSPAIAIQQKASGWNPRSTVGTLTGVYDFLRVLYARVGIQHCTRCAQPIAAQSREQIVAGILRTFVDADIGKDSGSSRRPRKSSSPPSARPGSGRPPDLSSSDGVSGPRAIILAPVARGQKGEFRDLFDDLIRAGYIRARVDGHVVELLEDLSLQQNIRHDIEVVIDRLTLASSNRARLAEAVEHALHVGKGTMIVSLLDNPPAPSGRGRRSGKTGTRKPKETLFSSQYACPRCGISFEPPSPQLFSFNSPAGMCRTCDGLGELFDFDPVLLVPDPSKDFWAPCIAPMRTKIGKWRRHIYEGAAKAIGCDLDKPWKSLSKKARDALLYGTGDRHITFEWTWSGGVWKHGGTFAGVIEELREKHRRAKAAFVRQFYERFMRRGVCPSCSGARLNAQALAVRLPVSGKTTPGPTIHEFCRLPVAEVLALLGRLSLSPVQKVIAQEILKELEARLSFLKNMGLHYLSLDRTAPSLSGGESQRIRLAGQIGSGLVGVLYILDEPSIGLHARDTERLLESLKKLRDMGNTVIVVEHDEQTIRAADHVVDFGPGPGVRGGRVVASGPPADIVRDENSLTGCYLRGAKSIPVPAVRRPIRKRGTGKQ